MQRQIWVGLFLGMLLLSGSVSAGTPNSPEITDDSEDSQIWEGEIVPHLEITKAWIQPKGDRFQFVIEVAGMPAMEDIPGDAVYVWHYSWDSMRLFWRADWDKERTEWRFYGGSYQGCKPPVCSSHDLEGHRQYAYMAGNATSQAERVQGFVEAGNPGRIGWTYPLDSYGEDRRGLEFKGLFVTTYKQVTGENESRSLRYVDIAEAPSDVDYVHKISSPWWAQFTPGPSPFILVAAAAVGVGSLRLHLHRRP